jgi:hypothetical protein
LSELVGGAPFFFGVPKIVSKKLFIFTHSPLICNFVGYTVSFMLEMYPDY